MTVELTTPSTNGATGPDITVTALAGMTLVTVTCPGCSWSTTCETTRVVSTLFIEALAALVVLEHNRTGCER